MSSYPIDEWTPDIGSARCLPAYMTIQWRMWRKNTKNRKFRILFIIKISEPLSMQSFITIVFLIFIKHFKHIMTVNQYIFLFVHAPLQCLVRALAKRSSDHSIHKHVRHFSARALNSIPEYQLDDGDSDEISCYYLQQLPVIIISVMQNVSIQSCQWSESILVYGKWYTWEIERA